MALVDTLTAVAANIIGTQTTRALSPVDIAFAIRTDFWEKDKEYLHWQSYYDGHHRDPRSLLNDPLALITSLGAGDYNWQPRHNAMAKVVDTVVNRLSVSGFTPDFGGPDDAPETPQQQAVKDALSAWWRTARMDETQNTVHAQAFIKGDAYLITRIAGGVPFWTYRDALMMLPVYDLDNVTMLSCYETWSEWVQDNGIARERRRLTIYRPNEISKWWMWLGGATWQPWTADGDGGVIAWVDTNGQPLGIPVHHFRNKPRGASFGRSELADLVALQDEYNRRAWDTSQASAFAG